ncbi:MAG: hypothetical protein COB41_00515 [Proteobacteria bacterium]|nr:MAG: hypothetical protein COB41_00515 [Pseudomonadota bacterium]
MSDLDKYLTEVKERIGNASEGPWDNEPASNEWLENSNNNYHFCRHARTDVPKLLIMLEKAVTILGYITDEANGKNECHAMATCCLSDLGYMSRSDKGV